MAYIAKLFVTDSEWYGPCPNKIGEFCGNAHRDDLEITLEGLIRKHGSLMKGLEGYEGVGNTPITNKRIGRPATCPNGSSERMAELGYVGIYLTKDHSLTFPEKEREVDTDLLEEEVVSGQRIPLRPLDPNIPMEKPV